MGKLENLNISINRRGYSILKVDTEKDQVMVHMSSNEITPYVVWSFDDNGETYWGNYFKTKEEAKAHYNNRTT